MIKSSPDLSDHRTFNPPSYPLSPPLTGQTGTLVSPHPNRSMFPFCFSPDVLTTQSPTSPGDRKLGPLDLLGYTTSRSYLDDLTTGHGPREVTRSGESPDRSGWPTVVDPRIPFTTYLQNLTRTLSMAAVKGSSSVSASASTNGKLRGSLQTDAVSPPDSFRACASIPSPCDVTPSPRSLSCGSQAEPDSSCGADEISGEVRDDDNDVYHNSEMEESQNDEGDNDDKLEKTELRRLKRRVSDAMIQPSVHYTEETGPPRFKASGKYRSCLFISSAHQSEERSYQGSLSAPVVPYSSLPTSPLSTLSASLPYHFRLHPLVKTSTDKHKHQQNLQQQQHASQQHFQLPHCTKAGGGGKGCSEANTLSSSLPVSLLQYHLQGQHHHHHHHQQQQQQRQLQQHQDQQEQRVQQHPHTAAQDGRFFLESSLFQPISGSSKAPETDVLFTKMLLESGAQPGASLMTSETPPGLHLPGSRGLSALTADVNGLLQTSFLGLGGLGMRRMSVDKPAPVKKYKCDVCQKAFSRSNTLVTHKRIHTGDKPFKCEVCGRAFRQPGNLTRHRLTHTTHKPYVCQVCNKAFNRASNLNTHIRTHTSFRQFAGTACPKTFHQKADLAPHVFFHTAEPRGFPH